MRAFRWTLGEGMPDIGSFGGSVAEARAASADGSVIVGWSTNVLAQDRGFRWTAETGMQDLGTLGTAYSQAFGVSADGSIIVGNSLVGSNQHAVLWHYESSCYADCDHSLALGIGDFICFQTLFATGNSLADCDESWDLDIDDFICFQAAFAAGC